MKGFSIEKEDMDVMLQLFDVHDSMRVSAYHSETDRQTHRETLEVEIAHFKEA